MKDCPQILDLLSTSELLEELGNRFDHCVFNGRRMGGTKDDEDEPEWFGDATLCKGLALDIIKKVNDDVDLMDCEEDDDEDD